MKTKYYDGERKYTVEVTEEVAKILREIRNEQKSIDYYTTTYETSFDFEDDNGDGTYEFLETSIEEQEAFDLQQERIDLLPELISKLTPHQQKIIDLVYYKKMDKTEVAKFLDVSKQTIQTLEKRILEKLRKKF